MLDLCESTCIEPESIDALLSLLDKTEQAVALTKDEHTLLAILRFIALRARLRMRDRSPSIQGDI